MVLVLSVKIYKLYKETENQMMLYKQSKMLKSLRKSLSLFSLHPSSIHNVKEEIDQISYLFLIDFINQKRFLCATITQVSRTQDSNSQSIYAVYQIQVITQDVYYKINKRYSQFKKLYDKLSKYLKFQSIFPSKTILASGSDDIITSKRIIQLNNFLQQVIQNNNDVSLGILLYQFLKIQQNYNLRKIDLNNLKKSQYILSYGPLSQFISLQIIKMNSFSKCIIQLFENIDQVLIKFKYKLQNQSLKHLLIGFNQYKGIIQFCMLNQNQLISTQGIKLILSLFNQQKNYLSQKYLKIYQTIPCKYLKTTIINLQQNSKFKQLYYKLIKLYVNGKINKNFLTQQILSHNLQIIKDYNLWLKHQQKQNNQSTNSQSNSQSNIHLYFTAKIFESIQHSKQTLIRRRSQQNLLKLQTNLQNCQKYKLIYQQIDEKYKLINQKQLDNGQYIKMYLSNQQNYIQININSLLSYQSLCNKIKNLYWNKALKQIIQIDDSNNISIIYGFNDNNYRKFKFQIIYNKQNNNQFKQIIKPLQHTIGDISFYRICKVNKLDNNFIKIIIGYYFPGTRSKNFFQSQIQGKTQIIFKSTIQNLIS